MSGVKPSPPDNPHLKSADVVEAARLYFTDVAPEMRRLTEDLARLVNDRAREWAELGESLARGIKAWTEANMPPRSFLTDFTKELSRQAGIATRLEADGWLPHYTMPGDDILSADNVSDLLEKHYVDGWGEIEEQFLENAKTYNLDEEALATFAEALTAHRYKLYRVPSRLIFPEIERLARTYLHDGIINKAITSQNDLREACIHLTPRALGRHAYYCLALMPLLKNHLYRYVTTEADLVAVKGNSTPNRHASMHGHISYANQQSSLNALIMGDFTFQVISALRTWMEADAEQRL